MDLNPYRLIDQLLADYASTRTRRTIHRLILLAGLLVTVWMAADGDWGKFATALGVSIYAAANKANTIPNLHSAGHDEPDDYEDGLSFEEAGGVPFPETPEIEPFVSDDPHPHGQ